MTINKMKHEVINVFVYVTSVYNNYYLRVDIYVNFIRIVLKQIYTCIHLDS